MATGYPVGKWRHEYETD